MVSPFKAIKDLLVVELVDEDLVSPPLNHVYVGRRMPDDDRPLVGLLVTQPPEEVEPANHGASVYRFPVELRVRSRLPTEFVQGEDQKDKIEDVIQAIAERYRVPVGLNAINPATGNPPIPNLLWTEATILVLDEDVGHQINTTGRIRLDFFIVR